MNYGIDQVIHDLIIHGVFWYVALPPIAGLTTFIMLMIEIIIGEK